MADPAPYANFRFRIKWDGKYVAGISKVGGLIRTTDVVELQQGAPATVAVPSPGRTRYEPITLERGVTQDTAFEQWANQTFIYGAGAAPSPNYRKDIVLDLYNEADQLVLSYQLYGCWPSQYCALPALDASVEAVAIESLTLQIEGWTRDLTVVPPASP